MVKMRALTFAALVCVASPAEAVVTVWLEVPHDESSARTAAQKFPEFGESAGLLLLIERLATADRAQAHEGVKFPYNYENLSQDQIEKRLGKPIEFKADRYARPCAGSEVVLPGGLQRGDLDGFMGRSRFYELKDVGGVLVFYSARQVAISPAVVYLRTDDEFVPLKKKEDAVKRLTWETKKLRTLKEWLGIPEDVAKNEKGEFQLTGHKNR